MFKDIMLPLPSWPKTVSRPALRRAVGVARLLEAHASCFVSEPTVPMPVAFRPYSAEVERQLDTRQAEVHATAMAELDAFREEAARAGISHEARPISLPVGGIWEPVVEHARLAALSVVPFVEGDDDCAELVQALVFESGRPVLVLPAEGGEEFRIDKVVIGWDFSRAAARAVADAMPLLRRAGSVEIVTISSDKQMPQDASAGEFIAHLARNDVDASLRHVERGRRSVGEALDEASQGADLLVIGAFGHSRVRDFFLGGATRHVLRKPLVPTFLSH